MSGSLSDGKSKPIANDRSDFLDMVEKVEGKTMDCTNCGTKLTCHMKDYGGDYKPKLQWQNEDGTAHYKTNNGVDFTCVIPDSTVSDTTPGDTPNLFEMSAKIDLIYAMMKEQYDEYKKRMEK